MLETLLMPEIQELIEARDYRGVRAALDDWTPPELAALISGLPPEQGVVVFRLLPREIAADTFEYLDSEDQQDVIDAMAHDQSLLTRILNDIDPDDRTALFEELPGPITQRLISLLSPRERRIAVMLLGYPEESIGRLMTPDYVAVRSDWTINETLEHIRRFGQDKETLDVIYVVDERGRLVDDLQIREILLADPESCVQDLMDHRFVSLKATEDQESAVDAFFDSDRTALPVTDSKGVLIGIVTVDDVLDVVEEEATEDIQKMGGMEALDDPYMSTPIRELVSKRARWLIVLFLGEMLTTTAMGRFEHAIESVTALAIFVPLIISSGGNSGSQASTLIIRALALGELNLRDWWQVMRREVLSGLALGGTLGTIGALRVLLAEQFFHTYGEHYIGLASTVGVSLVGIVLWGTLSGSMLPFVLKKFGADPAASSAPSVATLVDVTGVLIYFTAATIFLGRYMR